MPFRAFGDSDEMSEHEQFGSIYVSMPFRAFGDSDPGSRGRPDRGGPRVSMPFRAFGDSDLTGLASIRRISGLCFNALSGIRGF